MQLVLLPAIFFASLIPTMVGLGGGLICFPLFILFDFPKTTAVPVSFFEWNCRRCAKIAKKKNCFLSVERPEKELLN